MNHEVITSRDNSLLRHARAARDGKTSELIFVEGLRLCEDALRAGLLIEAVIYSQEFASRKREELLLRQLSGVCQRVAIVSGRLLASVSDTKTPQGIIILAARPETTQRVLRVHTDKAPLLVIMHKISNPANAGAIVRTAEASGAAAVIATKNSTDPFSPKALRGAMGSSFRLPIWLGPNYSESLAWCAEHGIRTVCADANATKVYTEIDWTGPRALILGSEASGLLAAETAAANDAVRIHMHGLVESLNVAVAAGVLLYEAARQREKL